MLHRTAVPATIFRSSVRVLGVDPGLSGAFAVIIDGDLRGFGLLHKGALGAALIEYRPQVAYLEQPFKTGAGRSMATTWRNYGRLFEYITLNGIRVAEVAPRVWVDAVKPARIRDQHTDTKGASRATVREFFGERTARQLPRQSTRNDVPHDGVCDAILIAHYGFLVESGFADRAHEEKPNVSNW